MNGKVLEEVHKFTNLGSIVSTTGRTEETGPCKVPSHKKIPEESGGGLT